MANFIISIFILISFSQINLFTEHLGGPKCKNKTFSLTLQFTFTVVSNLDLYSSWEYRENVCKITRKAINYAIFIFHASLLLSLPRWSTNSFCDRLNECIVVCPLFILFYENLCKLNNLSSHLQTSSLFSSSMIFIVGMSVKCC